MRIAARAAVVLCGLGSLACTLYAGRHNSSILLVGMFAVWVTAPFVALLLLLPRWERAVSRPATLHAVVIAGAITELLIYLMETVRPRGHNAAAPFLLLPIFCWGAIAILLVFVRRSR